MADEEAPRNLEVELDAAIEELQVQNDKLVRIELLYNVISESHDQKVTEIRHLNKHIQQRILQIARLESELKAADLRIEKLTIRDQVYNDPEKNAEISKRVHKLVTSKKK